MAIPEPALERLLRCVFHLQGEKGANQTLPSQEHFVSRPAWVESAEKEENKGIEVLFFLKLKSPNLNHKGKKVFSCKVLLYKSE